MTVSTITPWLNGSELIPAYKRTVAGAEIVAVDNASEPEHAAAIEAIADIYLRNETNKGFSKANNQGLAVATGDIILFCNNDIEASGLIAQVERDVHPGCLYGPSLRHQQCDGQLYPYLEGFCIAGLRATWELIGGWPDDLPGLYWDDNILCLNAQRKGIGLVETGWAVWHFSNYTSRKTPGAYAHSAANQERWREMVRNG